MALRFAHPPLPGEKRVTFHNRESQPAAVLSPIHDSHTHTKRVKFGGEILAALWPREPREPRERGSDEPASPREPREPREQGGSGEPASPREPREPRERGGQASRPAQVSHVSHVSWGVARAKRRMRSAFAQVSQPSRASREPCRHKAIPSQKLVSQL